MEEVNKSHSSVNKGAMISNIYSQYPKRTTQVAAGETWEKKPAYKTYAWMGNNKSFILKIEKRGPELDSSVSEQEHLARACENGNEHSCAIKCRD
jgi:hypothetical protein